MFKLEAIGVFCGRNQEEKQYLWTYQIDMKV
jgi:hypothetical protein